MIHLKELLDSYLRNTNWRNTNEKEQNFQGRLYNFLLHYEELGYIVEMETSTKDDHMPENLRTNDSLCKTEIDIIIYKKDFSEKYAIELKWFHSPKFHYFDRYREYQEDCLFVKQLAECGFDETCAVLVVNPEKMSNPSHARKDFSNLQKFGFEEILNDRVLIYDNGKEKDFFWCKRNGLATTGGIYYYIISYSKT